MRYWLPSKRTEWSAWQDCVQKVENLTWSDDAPSNKGMLFFKFDHWFPPWRLLGTKSRWSGFATENICCSLWLLQLRGEGALSISVWQCVETTQHLCWSGNCAQQCVKPILYSQIINNHSLSYRLLVCKCWRGHSGVIDWSLARPDKNETIGL